MARRADSGKEGRELSLLALASPLARPLRLSLTGQNSSDRLLSRTHQFQVRSTYVYASLVPMLSTRMTMMKSKERKERGTFFHT